MTIKKASPKEDAFEQFKKNYFEQHGKELSDQEASDIKDITQMLAEITYESWIGEKKKLAESKKNLPQGP